MHSTPSGAFPVSAAVAALTERSHLTHVRQEISKTPGGAFVWTTPGGPRG